MDGVLVIDKPAGITSHDVVSKVRRILKEKKVGHTGTLDPAATGVLPLVLGRATKLARYLSGDTKSYRAVVKLGETTTTLDGEGEVLQTRPVTCSKEQVLEVAASFIGEQKQVPPMYSAKKIDGKKLYELARQGIEIEREAKDVTIHSLTVSDCTLPELTFDVSCSAGTYVRVLAQDIGERLGCGAYLKTLRRTSAGPFLEADSITLEQLAEQLDLAKQKLVPMNRALSGLPRIAVPSDMARMMSNGYQLNAGDLRNIDLPAFKQNDALAVAQEHGDVIAVVRAEVASSDLGGVRRDQCVLKTERII